MERKNVAVNVDNVIEHILGDPPVGKAELVEYKKKKDEAKSLVTQFFNELLVEISNGRKVRIKNFGTFSCRHTKELVRQPLSNEIVKVSDRKRLKFLSSTRAVSKINSKGK